MPTGPSRIVPPAAFPTVRAIPTVSMASAGRASVPPSLNALVSSRTLSVSFPTPEILLPSFGKGLSETSNTSVSNDTHPARIENEGPGGAY